MSQLRWSLLALVAVGLGGSAPVPPPTTHLLVFAAASLTETFTELGAMLERRHPDVKVTFNFAGSQRLAEQIIEGAPADVFASADERWMGVVRDSGLVAGEPRTFVRNRLVVIVPQSNPARLHELADLARPGVKLVLAEAAVPVGAYARQALERMARSTAFAPDFARRVLANVVSEEQNVKAVVAKVQLGEADAGIVYTSDVTRGVEPHVRRIAIPDSLNVLATYPIAVLRDAPHAQAAQAFVALVLSAEGQAVLQRAHFVPVGGP